MACGLFMQRNQVHSGLIFLCEHDAMNYVQTIRQMIHTALTSVSTDLSDKCDLSTIQVEATKDPKHGDFATNIALMTAKIARMSPRELADKIIQALPEQALFSEIAVAGPGFINFTVTPDQLRQIIPDIISAKEEFGRSSQGEGQSVHLEYVSANPTGPLHVGHGRGAAYGSCVASLLKAVGYRVHQEYYVNDAGRQMRILALSVWLRVCALQGLPCTFPSNAYQGDYIQDIARDWLEATPDWPMLPSVQSIEGILAESSQDNADEIVDRLIDCAIDELGEEAFEALKRFSFEAILADIRQDLVEFGVCHDTWFYESELMHQGLLDASLQLLKDQGHVFEAEGAVWFRATTFGDDKDRVLVRENGQSTYFASDVAYHLYKYRQGYDRIVDVFGADHHGYIARIRAFLEGLGQDPERLRILLVQFAILYRGKEKVSMSTRGGQFVTLRQLRDEVGNDAARYFYVMRKPEQHLDFDLELAKSHSNDNPVYYIQYAHARICSVWRQCHEQDLSVPTDDATGDLTQLNSSHEQALIKKMVHYPRILTAAALDYSPHTLANYLCDLANHFHSYYNATKFLVLEESVRFARLQLTAAVRQILHNGLTLLGLSAPEKM